MVDVLPNSENQQEILIAEYRSQLVQMTELVLSDRLPDHQIDVLFFHARSKSDEEGLLEKAASLINAGRVKNIVIPGTDGQGYSQDAVENLNKSKQQYTAWSGRSEVSRKLAELGINSENLWFSGPTFHTNMENDAFLELSQRKSWTSAATLTHPHQLLRAFAGQVRSNLNSGNKPEMDIYCVYPDTTNWETIVAGSQGKDPKPRKEHAIDEYHRIVKYTQQGDLATYNELLKYWENRGGVNLQAIEDNRSKISKNPEYIRNVEIIREAINSLRPEIFTPLIS